MNYEDIETYEDAVDYEIQRRGLTQDDIAYSDPVSYDRDQWTIVAYHLADGGYLICQPSEQRYDPDDDQQGPAYGIITQEQYDDVTYYPDDIRGFMSELRQVAGIDNGGPLSFDDTSHEWSRPGLH